MQNLPIYLYPNTLEVILDLDATIRGVNQVMYQRDLKIQKGVKNQIRIQFKNSDQKRIHIDNSQTFVFSMFDALNQRLLIEKELEILETSDASKGMALLTLTENDTLDLETSSYQYSIRIRDTDGSYTPAYTNTYYGQSGTLQLLNEVFPILKDSTVIKDFLKTYNSDTFLYEYASGNIYSSPEFNGNNALHTVAIYLSRYKGTLRVEGTLDNSPGAIGNYGLIEQRTYDGTSGIDYFNFTGVYSYIKITYIPAKGPVDVNNDNSAFFGSVDKVLYRC